MRTLRSSRALGREGGDRVHVSSFTPYDLIVYDTYIYLQVLGRNLESLVNRAQELRREWGDEFVSIEHMLLALVEDARFGAGLMKGEGLDRAKIEQAIKDVRGSNKVRFFHGTALASYNNSARRLHFFTYCTSLSFNFAFDYLYIACYEYYK
jgi:ATP-dependent Clp protease ATP-binding subunit ClpA